MKHYEILLIIHPDQTDQVNVMVERYTSQVKQSGGQVHRLEDWGRRALAYPIQKLHKAHYILMNIECGGEALTELEEAIRYNDAVLRKLVLLKKAAVTTESPILKGADEKREERGRRGPSSEYRGDTRESSSEHADGNEESREEVNVEKQEVEDQTSHHED
ncbi:MAG: 30S ribosomal protein S6 [Gammaproteobacteria bacterium]